MEARGAMRRSLFARALLLASVVSHGAGGVEREEAVIATFDEVKDWPGLSRDTTVVKAGAASGKWSGMDEAPGITASAIPHDWSRYNALSLWIHNERKLPDTAFMIIIRSESKATEGPDYYALRVDLAHWTGWKQFLVPFRELGRARSPVGWHQIDSVFLTASGWGNAPNPKAVVRLDDFRLLRLARVEGPRMTDDELFAAMNLDYPGLEAVKAAVSRKNLAAAKAAWLDHLKARRTPKWHIDWRDRPPLGPPVDGGMQGGRRAPAGGSPGWDYYSRKLALDWAGWKHFRLAKADFGPSRKPIGWHWISYLAVNASGWGETPNPNAVLYLDDIRLVGKDKAVVLGDFEAGADNWSGLDPSDEQAKTGKRSGKWHHMHISTSLRLTGFPTDWTDVDALEFWAYAPKATGARVTLVLNSDQSPSGRADEICRHVIRGHDFGPDIDWSADPNHYREWTYAINRFYHWRTLAEAYWETGDEKYAAQFAAQLVDWARKNPVPLFSSGNGSYTWRTIECGIRQSTTWPDSLYRVLGSKSFTPDIAATLTRSMVEHARHLMKWPSPGSNWITMEANGLGTIGILLPELKEAAEWRRTAIDRLYRELDAQVYPDGAQIELTTGYHQVSLRNFLALARTAKLNDVPLPTDYVAKLKRMFLYNLYVMMPDRRTPALNDGGMGSVLRSMHTAFELYGDPVFEWAATRGARGTPPDHTSHHFAYAGQMVQRSGWEPEARYLLLDAGPFGFGHQHEDKLSIVVHALGKLHVVDPGNYHYDASPWRRYTIDTPAHNTILVDGQPQRRRGRRRSDYVVKEPLATNAWLTSDRLDYAAGQYDQGYGPGRKLKIVHRREVVFVKPDYWLVVDTLKGEGTHLYESLFHFDADEAVAEGTTARTIDPTPNCVIAAAPQPGLTVRIVKGQTEPTLQGFIAAQRWRPSWKSPKAKPPDHGKRAIPTAIFALRAKAPARLVYAIVPYPEGAAPTVAVEDASGQDGPVRVKVTRPAATDTITIDGGADVLRATGRSEPRPWATLRKK